MKRKPKPIRDMKLGDVFPKRPAVRPVRKYPKPKPRR